MGLGNRTAQHSFAQIPDVHINRSSFDRSYGIKDTFNFDYLVPIFLDEILPGDTCNVTLNTFARLATQKVPIMDNMYIDYHFFFVPCRLVHDNFQKLMGEQTNPGDSTDFLLPQLTFTATGPEIGSIYDKFGLPTDIPGAYTIKNTLPLRCYNLIWNEWYRDQNLQNSVTVPKDDGPDAVSDFTLLKRNKKHDYFTSALPWPQKGPAVDLPLGLTAPVIPSTPLSEPTFRQIGGTYNVLALKAFSGSGAASWSASPTITSNMLWDDPNLVADLSQATGATINSLREAFSMQALFELDARGGTRYVEILQAHFNVISPDFRLQRPEFLGGGTTRINSHPVANQSGTGTQASLAAFGTSSTQGQNIGFTKSFTEHGYVIGLASARADITYQAGLHKMWNRSTRFDFYWPKLAELGEQAILNKEIFIQGNANDENVFGYQERFAEYRYKPSEIHGQFRSNWNGTPLDMWHLAEEFSGLPALNSTFIQSTTPIERAIAVTSEPHLLFDCWFNYKHARPIPVYSVPATMGRF